MKETWKRVIIATFVLVSSISVGAYTAVVQNTKPGIEAITADGDWGSALRSCFALGGDHIKTPAGLCIYDVLWQAAKQDQILEASTAVTRFAEESIDFYGLCHAVVHDLGEKLFNFYGSIENAILAVNSRDCGTGLAHGVIDFWTMSEPTYEEFASAAAACEVAMSRRFGGCAEGIGHATYQHQKTGTERRLEKAFELCAVFKSEENQEFCAYGAMMQPYVKQNVIFTEKEISVPEWSEHLSICAGLDVPIGVQRGCYSGGGWIMGVDITDRLSPEGIVDLDAERIRQIAVEVDRGVGVCNSEVVIKKFRYRCTQEFLARMPVGWYRTLGALEERCAVVRGRHGDVAGDLCLSGAHEFTPPALMGELMAKYPQLVDVLSYKVDMRSEPPGK